MTGGPTAEYGVMKTTSRLLLELAGGPESGPENTGLGGPSAGLARQNKPNIHLKCVTLN